MSSDVLIIGGGIIGLSIARSLHKRGVKKITVLERDGLVGNEASSAAAGMLAPQAETDRIDDFFHFCNESNRLYPQFAEELLNETSIDIELERTGTLYLAFTEHDSAEIQRRYEWQRAAGLNVEYLQAEEVRKAEPFISPDVREALLFPDDWQVENRKVVEALRRYAELNGIEIITNCEVISLLKDGNRLIGAQTADQEFFAEKTVLATGAWTSLIKIPDLILPEVKPIRGQMLSFRTLKRLFFHVIYSPRGYIVPRIDGKILAGATVEDVGFEKALTENGIEMVWQNAVEIAPSLEKISIEEKWAGLRPFAADGLPILGSFPPVENLFTATAHYRNGILLAPVTGELMAERILGNSSSKYLESFSPQRFYKATVSGK